MNSFFDTHAHLDNPQLLPQIESVISRAREAGVVGMVAIGTNVASSANCIDLAEKHDSVWASVGIHPNQCREVNRTDWDQIQRLARHPKCVAIGETGLDRYWDYCPIEIQKDWFERHIQLGIDADKPIVVHMRECEADILDGLESFAANQPIQGIMHSYAGSVETVKQCLEWGMHISFAGMVTFKKSGELREVAKQVPENRLLIETDAPFLSPHPRRGQRPNEPSLVVHTAQCLADTLGKPVSHLGKITTRNACNLFGISL